MLNFSAICITSRKYILGLYILFESFFENRKIILKVVRFKNFRCKDIEKTLQVIHDIYITLIFIIKITLTFHKIKINI